MGTKNLNSLLRFIKSRKEEIWPLYVVEEPFPNPFLVLLLEHTWAENTRDFFLLKKEIIFFHLLKCASKHVQNIFNNE